ncbi:histidine kinase dimerization/phospho-acceptor domain-containing protein [Belnapia sp. F-4-1]|uniref:histidine kinase dimerization/phospho-acceptor domain-containing protein n=1 Tax=Belnapia sp. F-4-1 TaxID=1545443 RepID=UPI0005BD5085|nr:histidine kinase dimerization/phospho-acceptor domain-containing protein [Belnapia sp. F-4-1]
MTGQPPTQTDSATEIQAKRLASVATLARPVQHDINNLLTVVFANLELLKRTAAAGGPQRQLDRIQEAAKRLEGSTRAILSLLRRPVGQTAALRMSDILRPIHPLLVLLLPTGGALRLDLPEQDPPVLVDRAAFEDALLAMAREAAEAMPRGGALSMALEEHGGGVALAIRHPEGMALPGLEALAALARDSGGSANLAPDGLRLTLPAAPAAG